MKNIINNKNTKSLIIDFFKIISLKNRKKLYYLLLLIILSTSFELLLVTFIIPFANILFSSDLGVNYFEQYKGILGILNSITQKQLIFKLIITLSTLSLITGILKIYILKKISEAAASISNEISILLFKTTISQNYLDIIGENSSNTIAKIANVKSFLLSVIFPLLVSINSIFLVSFLSIKILSDSPLFSIFGFALIIIFYILISKLSKTRLRNLSKKIRSLEIDLIKVQQEVLGGIRDIKLTNNESLAINNFSHIDKDLRKSFASSLFISSLPKLILEFGGIFILCLTIGISIISNKINILLPTLTIVLYAVQRIIPAAQQVYSSYYTLQSNRHILVDFLDIIHNKKSTAFIKNDHLGTLIFNRNIVLKKISFSYPKSTNFLFNGIDLQIQKGTITGLIGKTGSGKSTLIDILSGLLNPIRGDLLIDGTKINNSLKQHLWRKKISYVPQKIFLKDASILENITYSNDKYDEEKFLKACKFSLVDKFIFDLPNNINSNIGERGVFLSGGQIQRIAIARALYNIKDFLILDEATSALDYKTESEIIKNITVNYPNITILIIAHRIKTLKNCSKIFSISNSGNLKEVSFEELNQ